MGCKHKQSLGVRYGIIKIPWGWL